ncbi:alpha/beta hydrolase [Alcaligenaceae bacterium]|nr:alpha/beta hydrolase [Alcaligenaceae bacterium]
MSFQADVDTGNPRRRFLAATAAAAAVALGETAHAQNLPAPKGQSVWLDLDQAALDKAYDQAHWASNIKTILHRYVANSKITRKHIGEPQRLRYGKSDIEALDLFTAKQPKAPIHIFIHGGAWRVGRSDEHSFLAEASLNDGAHFIAPDFVNVVQTGGDLMPMAEQVIRAIEWVYRNAASFDGDPGRIYLSGHSTGAHLATVALTTDWEKGFGLPADIIKGAVLISGIYDLKPVRLSARSNYVNFTDDIEHRLSPQRHLDKLVAPVTLVYGSEESPEFIRQSKDFADALAREGKSVELFVGSGYNHFEIIETLASPFGTAGRALSARIRV